MLSEAIDTRPFKATPGDGRKGPTVAVWLCFQPDEPSDSTDCTPTPGPAPKQPKNKGKAKTDTKKGIKTEIKKETVDKRPRSASSVEVKATRAMGMEQVKEEEILHNGDDVEEDLPPLEQLTGRK